MLQKLSDHSAIMRFRLKKLIELFPRSKIDALLILKDVNINYLTGFPAAESWLLVSPKRSVYITDFRYVLEARRGLKGVAVRRYTKSIYETFFQAAVEMDVKSLGMDERHMTLAQYRQMKRWCPKNIRLVGADGLVERLREVKEPGEIEEIRGALKIHKQAHQFLKKVVKPGMSEREVFLRLEQFVKSRGVKFSFDPIVASGPNSCYPHARVTDRKIRAGEPLLIDMGIDVKSYKSDLTRMFFFGRIPALVQEVNGFVAEAQRRAMAKIKAGASIVEVDRAARNYLAKKKLAKYFGHALGHGVGLEIHENPRLAATSPSLLKEGMVITVEPAVYLPDRFGIRIEDMALVTDQGCEILSDDIH
jgi:Xaa-Pro aminopeptidase